MKVILDTDKKTITVPYNYQDKLNEINKMIDTYGAAGTPHETFTGYIDKIWKECITDSDNHVRTGEKPKKKG
ncbi:MAG: hypothetical protein Q4C10_01260 [Clostridia bacterium]|nr:hypothetical protein [Clostridia bacterium]